MLYLCKDITTNSKTKTMKKSIVLCMALAAVLALTPATNAQAAKKKSKAKRGGGRMEIIFTT